ncbi:hypothetical protein [Caldovatus aquaticus]|uniref:Uncharacterized protein n=1 Tax=Caldovatus aquaticus TaxID=2865671 RepID=A0ABS7F1P4_9PROT|nr:hypothetical protein [Caldovatus aquaticus]MBW8269547.1 hypothetical protein [Caldovatus aquaticus]
MRAFDDARRAAAPAAAIAAHAPGAPPFGTLRAWRRAVAAGPGVGPAKAGHHGTAPLALLAACAGRAVSG